METDQIHKKIGRNLLNIRKARSLSLDQAAELTGVSKAMLGQIERGDSNPTISILWKIVNGLRISFTSLIEEESPEVKLIRYGEMEPFREEEGLYRAYPIIPFDQQKKFEVYIVEMDPDCLHNSEPHNEGVEEYIVILQGQLHVTIQEESYHLNAGDALHFVADKPHVYSNTSRHKAVYQTIIYYPS
ncbi:XRE family transcriptional regulator [Paenibacillus sp. GD4]|uniref:helix-turn-helix domain-containing protein n=1 Tax=Paenibacillus TaxID=44249 RepID=UPI0025436275|nr:MULTISPECIES: XRE family transcriptional regulator [Paenibacillus]MDQ1914803.1 XRE family transcriptional regulator [Paenibacillus sp. GD4]